MAKNKKISTIVSHCEECVFHRRYNWDGSEHGYIILCTPPTNKVVKRNDSEITITDRPTEIPDWCPLDDYQGDNKTYDILDTE